MLKPCLCDYRDLNILAQRTVTITGDGSEDAAKRADERNEELTLKNSAPFRKCITQMNNIYIDNAKHTDVVMLMYNLREYSDIYSEASGIFCQYHRDKQNDNTANFESFKFKSKIARKTPNDGNETNF